MLTFTFKSVVFLGVGIIILMGLVRAANYLDPPQSALGFRIHELLTNHLNVRAISVGHSHNVALDYRVLGYDAYGAWYSSSDLFEVEYELRWLVPRLKNLEIVLIPIAYFGFHHDNSCSESGKTHRMQYYEVFNRWPPIKGDIGLFLRSKVNSVIRPDHGEALVRAVLFGRVQKTLGVDPEDGHRIQPSAFEPMSYEDLDTFTRESPSGVSAHLKMQDHADEAHPHLSEDIYACVVRIIKFLQARDIRVVFFTPPYFVTYTELYYPETIRSMKARMQQLVDEYGVEYYNFSTDEDLIYNNLLFADDDHLNADGAVVFSKKLREAMHAHETVGGSERSP